VQILPGELRVLQPEQKPGAERRTCDRGGQDDPSEWSEDGISEAAAEGEIGKEGGDVGKSFEKQMGMDRIFSQVKINREECGEME
jgi:hypothetical protein